MLLLFRFIAQTGLVIKFFCHIDLSYSSSSFELFVMSIMQEDVYTLRKRSCSICKSSVRLGPPRRVDCVSPLPVCHIKMEEFR